MADKVAGFLIDPSEQAIKELGLPTYSQLYARVGQLEAALREIAVEVKDAHDGLPIFRVREMTEAGRGDDRCRSAAVQRMHERIAELRASLLAVIRAYDDNDDAPDPEKALSDAIQAARVAWPEK